MGDELLCIATRRTVCGLVAALALVLFLRAAHRTKARIFRTLNQPEQLSIPHERLRQLQGYLEVWLNDPIDFIASSSLILSKTPSARVGNRPNRRPILGYGQGMYIALVLPPYQSLVLWWFVQTSSSASRAPSNNRTVVGYHCKLVS